MEENDEIFDSKASMMEKTITLLEEIVKKFELNDFLLEENKTIDNNIKEESK